MTAQEFSNEFDILYNNIMSNQAPGLDEYEKSVFLTQAQEDVVKALYQGTSAGLGPFENTEQARRELSNLIITKKLEYTDSYNGVSNTQIVGQKWNIPDDVLYIIQEYYIDNESTINVVPTTYDQLQKVINNPFRGASRNRILRLDYSGNTVILIKDPNRIQTFAGDKEEYYCLTYIKKPYPIILTNVGDLSINGKATPLNEENPCELSSSIHRLILTQAVQLAAAAYKS